MVFPEIRLPVDIATVIFKAYRQPAQLVRMQEVFFRIVADVGIAFAGEKTFYFVEIVGTVFVASRLFRNQDTVRLDKLCQSQRGNLVALGQRPSVGDEA